MRLLDYTLSSYVKPYSSHFLQPQCCVFQSFFALQECTTSSWSSSSWCYSLESFPQQNLCSLLCFPSIKGLMQFPELFKGFCSLQEVHFSTWTMVLATIKNSDFFDHEICNAVTKSSSLCSILMMCLGYTEKCIAIIGIYFVLYLQFIFLYRRNYSHI